VNELLSGALEWALAVLNSSAQGWVGSLVMFSGFAASAAAARYLPVKRKKSDHHRRDIVRSARRTVVENAIKAKSAAWGQLANPESVKRTKMELQAAKLRIEHRLVDLRSIMELIAGTIDKLQEKKAVNQSFENMMQPGSEVRFNTPSPRVGRGDPNRNERLSQAVTSFRDAVDMGNEHYNNAYNAPGVKYELDFRQAIRDAKIEDTGDLLDKFLSGYFEKVGQIIKAVGMKSYLVALDWVDKVGPDGFDRKTYDQAYKDVEKAMKKDNKIRKKQGFSPMTENPRDLLGPRPGPFSSVKKSPKRGAH
jgi:hypothetical protein